MVEPLTDPHRELAALVHHPWHKLWGDRGVPMATSTDHQTLRASAVLVACTPSIGDDVSFLLVERSPTTRHHPGQFAFPGGGIDPGEDAMQAAIRECHEESGINVTGQEVLGALPPLVLSASGNVVTPVLAWLGPGEATKLPDTWSDPEIAARYWVPRSTLINPENRATIQVQNRWAGPGFLVAGKWVWGFTAIVLDELLTALGWNEPWDQNIIKQHTVQALPKLP